MLVKRRTKKKRQRETFFIKQEGLEIDAYAPHDDSRDDEIDP